MEIPEIMSRKKELNLSRKKMEKIPLPFKGGALLVRVPSALINMSTLAIEPRTKAIQPFSRCHLPKRAVIIAPTTNMPKP
jgi:hypothetical protein